MNSQRKTSLSIRRNRERREDHFSRARVWIAAVVAPVTVIGIALMGTALPANAAQGDPQIVVNAGGIRTGDTTVGPLPDGAVVQAVANPIDNGDNPPTDVYTCTISNGSCTITVPTLGSEFNFGYAWDVSVQSAPDR